MSINQRITKVIEYSKLQDVEFARLIGVTKQYISAIQKEGYSVGKSPINKIIDKFSEINAGWLLTGEGTMLRFTIFI